MLETLGTNVGLGVMPANPEKARCYQNRWVDYELGYSGDSIDGVAEELKTSRDDCGGFINHEPGSTPQQHLDRQEQLRKERVQSRIALLAFLGALLGALIPSILSRLLK